MYDMPELKVTDSQVILTNIIPAQGWKAVFADKGEGESLLLSTEPVLCWGLETIYDNHYSMHPVATKVVGMISIPEIVSAEDMENFVGYLKNDMDAMALEEYAKHLLEHEEDDESSY